LLGPPAAGKGTQAELLKQRFGFETPSVGAMLREQKAAGTPVGLRAAQYFERGLLVPDEVSIEVVRQWLARHHGASWVLDGYPRTVGQAEAFDAMCREQAVRADLALLILADEAVIRDRVAHRLICQNCGAVFREGARVASPSDACPRCGGALGRRADDKVEALADRLSEYRTKTAPVLDWYAKRGILRTIDGNRDIDSVFADVSAAIESAA
jgi:adenylate kinase